MKQHIVNLGDTLFDISRRYGITLKQLLEVNPTLKSPYIIFINQVIELPDSAQETPIYYTVRSGDSLYKISQRFALPLSFILSANPQINNINQIWVGQKIYLPVQKTTKATGRILYTLNNNSLWQIQASGLNDVQIPFLKAETDDSIRDARWSPDGKHIAYKTYNQYNLYKDGYTLYIAEESGLNPILLAKGMTDYAWANSSQEIAIFSEFSDSNGMQGLYTSDLTGGERKLVSNARSLGNINWLPGDNQLVAAHQFPDTNLGMGFFFVNQDGTHEKTLPKPKLNTSSFSVSPNGKYAAGTMFNETISIPELFIYEFLTGKEIPIVIPNESIRVFIGDWSPDSNLFACILYPSSQGKSKLVIADIHGTIVKSTLLDFEPAPSINWRVSMDLLALGTTKGIRLFNRKTGELTTVVNKGPNLEMDWIE